MSLFTYLMSYKRIFTHLIALTLALFASNTMLHGTGFFNQTDIASTGLFALMILLLASSRRRFYFLLLPLVLPYLLYMPIGQSFGAPSYQYVASVFATDLQESREFFRQIPWRNIALTLATFAILFALHWLSRAYRYPFYRYKLLLIGVFFVLFWHSRASLFLREGGAAIAQVTNELQRLNRLSIESQWGKSILTKASRYDDYVLIIGESARKDYHHAYGYPIENTPFMSNTNGTLINGLSAGGTNTIASLKLMLTQPNTTKWEGNYALNLIDLVKSADIRTYWLSNQGYLGTFDTPISSIANKSDERFFTKSGDSFHKNISDFKLLPKFEQVIAQRSTSKRFIVLHLYGSHPLSCDRVTDYPQIFSLEDIEPKYHNINCYISSIKKTDAFLAQVHQLLLKNQQQQGRTFSMIYFADHGLAHKISENNIDLLNMSRSQFHLEVPLFKLSSDDTERNVYHAFKSGLHFTNGIANWMGIYNPKLSSEIDLFSPIADKQNYGLADILKQYDQIPDPAVVIPKRSK